MKHYVPPLPRKISYPQKSIRAISLFALLVFILFALTACSGGVESDSYILNTPDNIQINNDLITWNAVDNATFYYIEAILDDDSNEKRTTSSNTNSCPIINLCLSEGAYKIRIQANSNSERYLSSEFSSYRDYTVSEIIYEPPDEPAKQKLLAPTNVQMANGFLMWSTIENATGYFVCVVFGDNPNAFYTSHYTATSVCSVSDLHLVSGSYELKIIAIGDSNIYLDSDFSFPYPLTVDNQPNKEIQEAIEREIAEINNYIDEEIATIENIDIPQLEALYTPVLIELAELEYELRFIDRYLGTQEEYKAELKEYSNQLQSLSISHQKNQKFVEECKKAGFYGDSYYKALAEIQAYSSNRKLIENKKSALEKQWQNQLEYLDVRNAFFELHNELQKNLSYYENKIETLEAQRAEMIEEVYKTYGVTPLTED